MPKKSLLKIETPDYVSPRNGEAEKPIKNPDTCKAYRHPFTPSKNKLILEHDGRINKMALKKLHEYAEDAEATVHQPQAKAKLQTLINMGVSTIHERA